jgi:hypothetical protein
MSLDVLALNLALVAGNVYFLLRSRARTSALHRIAQEFTNRLMTGRVIVINADTGEPGRLRVVPAGDDALCLYIEPLDTPPAIH